MSAPIVVKLRLHSLWGSISKSLENIEMAFTKKEKKKRKKHYRDVLNPIKNRIRSSAVLNEILVHSKEENSIFTDDSIF